ncbi:MAG: hypothetical protein M3N98_07230 [Actinomycetota bacterium]|nr:hypothetical protein [Actinomycetota bacterium]
MGVALTGFYVGFAIAVVVIAIVVVLVSCILVLARRIAQQALAIEESLAESQVNTLPLWDVSRVNDRLYSIVGKAEQARAVVEEL